MATIMEDTTGTSADGSSGDNPETLRRALAGDRPALESLLAGERAGLVSFVRHRLRAPLNSQVDVDDVVQETLTRAFQRITIFRGDDGVAFSRWLRGFASNVIFEAASRARRRPAQSLQHEPVDEALSQSMHARREERFDRLQEALDTLSPEHREVILLARVRRLPIKEVAQHIGRTPNATAQLLWRAVQKLRTAFGDTESLHLPRSRRLDEGQVDE